MIELIVNGDAKRLQLSTFYVKCHHNTFDILPETAMELKCPLTGKDTQFHVDYIKYDLSEVGISMLHSCKSEFVIENNSIIHKATGNNFDMRYISVQSDEFKFTLSPIELANLMDTTCNYDQFQGSVINLCGAVQEQIFDINKLKKLLVLNNGDYAFIGSNMGGYKKHMIDDIFIKFANKRPARKIIWTLKFNPSAVMGILAAFHDAPHKTMQEIIKYCNDNQLPTDAEAITYVYGVAQELRKRTSAVINL